MSNPGAGFEYPPQEVSWNQRDVLLFANSIGCTTDELHFLYVRSRSVKAYFPNIEPKTDTLIGTPSKICGLPNISHHPSYVSPVFFPSALVHKLIALLAFKLTNPSTIDFYAAQKTTPIPGVPAFDSRRVVDGQRLITFHKPLPPTSSGSTFELRSKVIGVYDKGKAGSVVETQQDIVDAKTGETYTSAVGSAFFIGQGGWGGPKGPATVNFPPPEGKKPDVVVSHQTTKESALLYRYEVPHVSLSS